MNIVRQTFVFGIFIMCLPGLGFVANQADGQEVELRFEEYEQKLNAILLTRRDEERDFVKKVVAQVEAGVIPERLVETSYKWVMNKRPDTKYPFVYFEKVLRIQAKKLEIAEAVPVFDYEIYNTRAKRQRR